MLLQTEYNEVVVLQQGGDSSVHNSRWMMGKVTGTRKLVKKSKHTKWDAERYNGKWRDWKWKCKWRCSSIENL